MKNNITTIMKKEFARFFGDRRMLIVLLLPGILIYVVYSFMGAAITNNFGADESRTPVVYAENAPASLRALAKDIGFVIADIPSGGLAEIKDKVARKEAELCAVFPADFDARVEAYDINSGGTAPSIAIFFNSTDANSQRAYGMLTAALDAFETSIANKFDINREVAAPDLASKEDTSASVISSLMPMLMMIFLYSGCVGIAPESIAGEKERGTIATLLVTPLRRSHLAIGKILSLGVLAFLCGLVTAAATVMALPKLMGGAADSINVNIYSAADYLGLALVILSTILLLITIISIVSAFAKTVKEAGTAVMPLMVVVMLIGVTAMFGGGAKTQQIYYIIPLYNSVQCMSGIFSLEYSAVSVGVACLSNFVYACIGGFVLTRMFNSEKVMFSR